ncbi:hypothetical protein ES703_96581 [subsurface metagenome]
MPERFFAASLYRAFILRAVFRMLREVNKIDFDRIDYNNIQAVKEYIALLMNTKEEIIRQLKDENARLKGRNPKPKIKPKAKSREKSFNSY